MLPTSDGKAVELTKSELQKEYEFHTDGRVTIGAGANKRIYEITSEHVTVGVFGTYHGTYWVKLTEVT